MHEKLGTDIAEWTKEKYLTRAELEGRFSPQETEYHVIRVTEDGKSTYEINENDFCSANHNPIQAYTPWPTKDVKLPDTADAGNSRTSCLRCILQPSRPRHVSGVPDPLPFENMSSIQEIFGSLDLPASYFEVADGSPATVHSYINYNKDREPSSLELVAHCVAKQGDWAIALKHSAATSSTSVFWSLQERIDSSTLKEQLNAFSQYSMHPMLIPCIMLSATLEMALQRRHSIKNRLNRIEKAVARISEEVTATSKMRPQQYIPDEDTYDLEYLFGLLHGCRNDQVSRKGRYDFWASCNEAIEQGFKYAAEALPIGSSDQYHQAHSDLQKWKSLTWQRLKSLMARDEDHNSRVDNVSYMLYTLNQQRDIRLQSSIAQASQRDSEDMKYIAVLGSIFLPASLVATILNVPEFQFLPGPQLFAVYVAITVPLIIVVVFLCLARRYRHVWGIRHMQAILSTRRSTENLHENPLRSELPTRQNTASSRL